MVSMSYLDVLDACFCKMFVANGAGLLVPQRKATWSFQPGIAELFYSRPPRHILLCRPWGYSRVLINAPSWAQVTEYNEELLPTNSDRLSAHPNDRVDGAPMHIRGATHSLDETCRTSVCHY
jgi:hypothetical protein